MHSLLCQAVLSACIFGEGGAEIGPMAEGVYSTMIGGPQSKACYLSFRRSRCLGKGGGRLVAETGNVVEPDYERRMNL